MILSVCKAFSPHCITGFQFYEGGKEVRKLGSERASDLLKITQHVEVVPGLDVYCDVF